MFSLHHLLSSLLWFLSVAEVMVMAAILEDEDVNPLEMNVDPLEVDVVPLKKDPGNVSTVDAIITSPRSVGINLDNLSEHSYLILILLPCVLPVRSLHPLFLTLPLLYCRSRSMIDFHSYSSLGTIFQRVMHLFRYACLYYLSQKALNIRHRSLISYDRY